MAARLASRFHVAWAIAARTTNIRDEYDMREQRQMTCLLQKTEGYSKPREPGPCYLMPGAIFGVESLVCQISSSACGTCNGGWPYRHGPCNTRRMWAAYCAVLQKSREQHRTAKVLVRKDMMI